MYFDNRLTEDDMQRAHNACPNPPPALLIAGSYCAQLEAIDIFTQEYVHPVTSKMLNLGDREKVLLGLYYRSVGFCRTAMELKSAIHQQALTSMERSVIELYVDMELVHRGVFPDAIERALAFTDWQKLKAARRMDRFFAGNPDLDTNPSKATVHRAFIANNEQRIVDRVRHLGGQGAKPDHWTGLDLITRAQRLDKDVEYLVMKDYDRRNFYVHTGFAGIFNISKQNFEQLCMFALTLIGDCMLKELAIIGKELRLSEAIPEYDDAIQCLGEVQVYAFANKILQSRGEPDRYFIQKGRPPTIHIA